MESRASKQQPAHVYAEWNSPTSAVVKVRGLMFELNCRWLVLAEKTFKIFTFKTMHVQLVTQTQSWVEKETRSCQKVKHINIAGMTKKEISCIKVTYKRKYYPLDSHLLVRYRKQGSQNGHSTYRTTSTSK